MKHFFTFITLLGLVLFFSACTKENEFLEKPTLSKLSINTTSTTKNFEVWLDDQLLKDSINLRKNLLEKPIPSGKHRLRIRQFERNDYFVDTLMNFAWSTKPYQFSLIELAANTDPFLFTGFPSDLPIPDIGYSTIGLLNTDQTLSLNKTIDLIFYERRTDNILVELKNIPYGIIKYFQVSDATRIRGVVVLKNSETGEILYNGRSGNTLITLYSVDARYNTYLLRLNNSQDASSPRYSVFPLISDKR